MRISVLVVAASLLSGGEPPRILACDGPDADPWVTDLRNRIESYDTLYRVAVERYGPPSRCDGEVTMEFDGAWYGVLTLDFVGGARFQVETMPPEASVTSLSQPAGFTDLAGMREALVAYAAARGLAIDWTSPEVASDDGATVRTYWDPAPGLNASASLVFRGDALVALRLSLAP